MSKQSKNFYKPFILCLLISFLAFLSWSAWQASERGSQVTDRDYYSKGLKYNSTLVEKRAAEVLGWSLDTHISDKTLTFNIIDGNEKNVTGARGILHIYLPDHPKGRPFELEETTTGSYLLDLPENLSGTLRARVAFERNGAKINRQLQLNL